MRRALFLGFALCACTVHTQGVALSGWVDVALDDSEGISVAGPVGAAVVWVGQNGVEATASVVLSALDAGARLPLEAPPDFALLDAGPVDTLTLEGVLAYRPRLVVFEDTNGTGAFEFDGLDAGAGDRVLAVDGDDSVAFVPDPEGMLASFTSSDTDAYYAATGGRFTPYLRVSLNGQGTLDLVPDGPVTLTVREGQTADANLGCLRNAQSSGIGPVPAASGVIHVNAGVDAASVCSKAFGTCVQERLDAQRPATAPVNLDDHARFVACMQSGLLESVLVYDVHQRCAGCSCSWSGKYDAYVSASASLPPWWPCGVSLRYCSRGTDLLTLTSACANLKL